MFRLRAVAPAKHTMTVALSDSAKVNGTIRALPRDKPFCSKSWAGQCWVFTLGRGGFLGRAVATGSRHGEKSSLELDAAWR
jgi:hypothetical protein